LTPRSHSVDIFNAYSDLWTTAVLSVARSSLSAAALPQLGIAAFAGGRSAPAQRDLLLLSASDIVFDCPIIWNYLLSACAVSVFTATAITTHLFFTVAATERVPQLTFIASRTMHGRPHSSPYQGANSRRYSKFQS
jgi:hypothetical protein